MEKATIAIIFIVINIISILTIALLFRNLFKKSCNLSLMEKKLRKGLSKVVPREHRKKRLPKKCMLYKELRAKSGLTQDQLGRKIGLNGDIKPDAAHAVLT